MRVGPALRNGSFPSAVKNILRHSKGSGGTVIQVDPKPENADRARLKNLCIGVVALSEAGTGMAKRGHTEEQILRVLHQAEGGMKVSDVCREHGISEATYYVWKKKYAGFGPNELRELRQLREENAKLKQLVADLSLDRQLLQEILRKKP